MPYNVLCIVPRRSLVFCAMATWLKWKAGTDENDKPRSYPQNMYKSHDDVIKWKHFPRYWPFVRGIHRSSVHSPRKGQWRGALRCLWLTPEQTAEQTLETPVSSLGRLFGPPWWWMVENGGVSASGHHLGWPHFRFLANGNEVIQDGDRKRKGRHFPPSTTKGVQITSLCLGWHL